MIKNSILVATAIKIFCLMFGAVPVWAQDDFDLFNMPSEPQAAAEKPKIDVQKTFSENLENGAKQKTSAQDSKSNSDESVSWLKSLYSDGLGNFMKPSDEKAAVAEQQRIEQVLQKRRSNAANFDISGVKLRMSPEEAENALTAQGYRRISQEKSIPNFIKWRSEELCRQNGIIGFERLNMCATTVSEKNGYRYIAHEIYNRVSTKETIEVFYTSTFTDNLSHRIYYKSDVPFSASRASNNIYINNLKVYDFWQRIDQRYGPPDNASEVKWGLGGKKPYLKASTGKLELVDPLLKNLDISRMINEDARFSNLPYYTF